MWRSGILFGGYRYSNSIGIAEESNNPEVSILLQELRAHPLDRLGMTTDPECPSEEGRLEDQLFIDLELSV